MKKVFAVVLSLSLVISCASEVFAQAADEEIQVLKQQVQALMQRIEKLESDQAQARQETAKAKEEIAKVKESAGAAAASRVDLANVLSKLKLKGRAALGFFDSGKAGSFPAGSFEVPDAKIQFGFQPDDINTVVMRFNLSNATAQNPLLDYFFLQSKDFLPLLKGTPFSLSGRLGRFKLGFGEETLSDNAVEGILPSNSAGRTGATDEGLELSGKVDLAKLGLDSLKPLGWVVSISDGNSGVGSDNSASKAFMGKLYYTPINPLYLSFSYYDSGDLGTGNAEMSIAGLATRPAGSNTWQRQVWEANARYDFGKGKKPLDPSAFSDSKAIVRLSYGEFQDSGVPDRFGNFGFVDGIYNLTKKFYTAARYSFVNLDGNVTAALNNATANRHDRSSLGVGYRWSENTLLKLSYDWNKETGTNTEEVHNNLLSAVVASQF